MKFVDTTTTYLALSLLGIATAWKQYLTFENCYNFQTYVVNDDKSYEITWNGKQLTSNRCQFSFDAYEPDHAENDYKVCIQATGWNIHNTQVKLKYYTGFGKSLRKTFSYLSAADNPRNRWCVSSSEYTYIELDTQSSDLFQGSLTLEVTGKNTYNYNTVIGWSVGGAVGGVILISLCVIIVIVVACRRRRASRGKLIYGTPNTTGTIVTQSGGGYANPGYTTGQQPPQYNSTSTTGYPVVGTPGYQQQTASYQQYPGSEQTQQQTKPTTEKTTQEQP